MFPHNPNVPPNLYAQLHEVEHAAGLSGELTRGLRGNIATHPHVANKVISTLKHYLSSHVKDMAYIKIHAYLSGFYSYKPTGSMVDLNQCISDYISGWGWKPDEEKARMILEPYRNGFEDGVSSMDTGFSPNHGSGAAGNTKNTRPHGYSSHLTVSNSEFDVRRGKSNTNSTTPQMAGMNALPGMPRPAPGGLLPNASTPFPGMNYPTGMRDHSTIQKPVILTGHSTLGHGVGWNMASSNGQTGYPQMFAPPEIRGSYSMRPHNTSTHFPVSAPPGGPGFSRGGSSAGMVSAFPTMPAMNKMETQPLKSVSRQPRYVMY
ncbi:hypothetical protein BS50DRAFT_240709 [Corynespora cassiicola Philippines]|uniref:Uncharacterized protein n=1 Tax=Corynespora cassiicola Philippines TaxID=1448308 RepID=A0A2T2P2X9_CORCC|nr:hypothetical protein BS50DRAFT_240709 [Corynespora cassiicola Philippines]